MRDENIKDAIEFVRELLHEAFWHIGYHERQLVKAHKLAGFAREMLERCGIDRDEVEMPDEDDGDEMELDNVEQFICNAYDNAVGFGVEHHERRLKIAHDAVAFTKSLLMRGNYTEIDVAEVQRESDERLAKAFNE